MLLGYVEHSSKLNWIRRLNCIFSQENLKSESDVYITRGIIVPFQFPRSYNSECEEDL